MRWLVSLQGSFETLHQTFELIRTILLRLGKAGADLLRSPTLEQTLHEIDKFSRRADKNHPTKLSEDRLSELADLLVPFDLGIADDGIQYIGTSLAAPASTKASGTVEEVKSRISKSETVRPPPRDAFAEMMRGRTRPSKADSSQPTPPSVQTTDYDEDFLDAISIEQLEIIEKRAKATEGMSAAVPIKVNAPPKSTSITQRFASNGVVKPSRTGQLVKIIPGPKFTSKVMQDLRREHRQERFERHRDIGGVIRQQPAASRLGTGLGAYVPRKPVQQVKSSDSSASEDSSDDETRGLSALTHLQKSPAKVRPVNKRPIKVLGVPMDDIFRQREAARASAHAVKQRLRPDLNPLFRSVLAWDPLHHGPLAPRSDKPGEIGLNLEKIPLTFPSATTYHRTMQPLFLQELWAQFLKDQSQRVNPINVEIITGREYQDEFIEVDIAVIGILPGDFSVNESDIVILRSVSDNNAVFAKVQAFRRRFKDTTIRIRLMNSRNQTWLGIKSKLMLTKHVR